MSAKKKILLGFITYGQVTAKYLPFFLQSLKQQTEQDFKIMVVDNSQEKNNANVQILQQYPEIEYIWTGKNLGFGSAYNLILNYAEQNNYQYFAMFNPDMILEKDCLQKLEKRLQEKKELGAVSPLVLKWDFVNKKKTNIIDTGGIRLKKGFYFYDIYQGEKWLEQTGIKDEQGKIKNNENKNRIRQNEDRSRKILGPSGCAGLFRLSALQDIKMSEHFFDPLFFMYKEDVDLAYRFFLAGWSAELVFSAQVYHDRSSGITKKKMSNFLKNRKEKNKQIKQWSFYGQQILIYKFWSWQSFLDKLLIIWREIEMLFFILIWERYLFMELKKVWQIRKKIIASRKLIQIKK